MAIKRHPPNFPEWKPVDRGKVDIADSGIGQNLLSCEAKTIYRGILEGNATAPTPTNALDEVLSLRLAAPDTNRPGHYVALSPSAAALHWQAHFQAMGSRYLSQAAAVPNEFSDLIGAYQLAQPQTTNAIEYLTGLDVVQDRLTPLLAACEKELLTAQPNGARPAAQLALSYQRDLAVLQRGVTMRTIYHCSVREHAPTARWAETVGVHGAQVRTVPARFPRTVIIDRKVAVTAVLTEWSGPAPAPERALLIHDEALVRCLASMLDILWACATPWDGKLLIDVTLTQGAILRRLVAGESLEVIGRALGYSRRTVSTHLEPLRSAIGVESIPQLTYWWAKNEAHYS